LKENRISRIDESNVNDSSSEGFSIDSYESDMFDGKAAKIESCSSENSLFTDSEVGIQIRSSLNEKEDDLTLVKNESTKFEDSKLPSINSFGSELCGGRSAKIEQSLSEMSVGSKGSSIDSCESKILGGKATKIESCSWEHSLLPESEVGVQLESFLTEEDDDLTLAGMRHMNSVFFCLC